MQPWALFAAGTARLQPKNQKSRTAPFQPKPAGISPQTHRDFRGTWRKRSVPFWWGKTKASAKLTLYAALRSFLPRTAPQPWGWHRLGASAGCRRPSPKCQSRAECQISPVHRRTWKDLGGWSPGIDALISPRIVNRGRN